MVHSSLSSLGYVVGGARTVIAALTAVLGPRGTLVMPSHSWDRSGHGDFRFDVKHTASCVGTISEVFRRMPGVSRSLHPTHSVVARGPQAHQVTEGHEQARTPCGDGTPYAKLIELGGQILFLGTTLDQNTLFHTLEDLAGLPYLLRDHDDCFIITDASGATFARSFRRQDRGPDRRFAATRDELTRLGILRRGRVGRSSSLLLESAPLLKWGAETLRRDPTFLLAQERHATHTQSS